MKIAKILGLTLLAVLVAGLLLPERIQIPVAGASAKDWNSKSFWFEPWGSSGVHKGIDIFGKTGTPVLSTTDGVVLFTGEIAKGGKVVLMLGPRWRLHYFAHLDSIRASAHGLASADEHKTELEVRRRSLTVMALKTGQLDLFEVASLAAVPPERIRSEMRGITLRSVRLAD